MKPPKKAAGCEFCKYRNGNFFPDAEDKNITRIYCKARHTAVNAELMSKSCDFYETDPASLPKKEQPKGL